MELPERSLIVEHFDEPALEFGYNQSTSHPKDGLFLYGPHAKDRKTRELRIGVIGTEAGIGHFRAWAEKVHHRVEVPPPGKGEKADRLHLANFPGLEAAFGITFDPKDCSAYVLDLKEINRRSLIVNLHEAVAKVVELYVARAKRHVANDERPIDLWVIVVPELIYERCRPQSKRTGLPREKGDFGKGQRTRSDLPLFDDMIDHKAEDIFDDVPDFHRQIKASFLSIGPTQILRQTTLSPESELNKAGFPVRRTQDVATVAWNLTTGLYYKTQPRPPWRLASVRPKVCYVGLVYKLIPNDANDHACCAAQMFLNEGDGVVFRGANGPWRTNEREFHLGKTAANSLLTRVVETYAENHDGPPSELFIHGQTNFNDEEWRAFEQAAPPETNVVGVRIRPTGGETKLFRDGDYPVLRGTALILDDRNAYLWTTGYVPQLDTYIGPETPNPLFVTLLRSKDKMPDIRAVLGDIMGLTKINYNSCNFNDGLPVTIRFAQMVGEVLVLGSAKGADKQPFKYYV